MRRAVLWFSAMVFVLSWPLVGLAQRPERRQDQEHRNTGRLEQPPRNQERERPSYQRPPERREGYGRRDHDRGRGQDRDYDYRYGHNRRPLYRDYRYRPYYSYPYYYRPSYVLVCYPGYFEWDGPWGIRVWVPGFCSTYGHRHPYWWYYGRH